MHSKWQIRYLLVTFSVAQLDWSSLKMSSLLSFNSPPMGPRCFTMSSGGCHPSKNSAKPIPEKGIACWNTRTCGSRLTVLLKTSGETPASDECVNEMCEMKTHGI